MQNSAKEKIGVLHIVTGLKYGGAERVILDLIKFGDKQSFDFYVTGLMGTSNMKNDFIDAGVVPEMVGLNKINILKFLKFVILLRNKVKRNNIKIIHAHMFHSGFVASLIKLLIPSISIVFTSHSITLGSNFRDKLFKLIRKLRTVDIIFSPLMKKDFYTSDTRIIPNGVEIKSYIEKGKNDKFTFISIAGLRAVKNHIHLIKCAQTLVEKGIRDFEIWLVGSGETKEMLLDAITKYKLQDYVILKGFQKNVLEFASKAHCFVMPSHWEGFPISILEAGLVKLPVLSTPVGSIPDMLAENCGYLATQNEFADKMVYIKNNYEEAKNRGIKLNEKVKTEYDIKAVVRLHEKLYKSISKS